MAMRLRRGVDVVVVRDGTAGRTGANTLFVERYGQIGEMTSAGMTYLEFLDGQGRPMVRGISQEGFAGFTYYETTLMQSCIKTLQCH